jgi:hypothetical protein
MYWKNMVSLDDEEIEKFIVECLPDGMTKHKLPMDKVIFFLRRYESAMNIKLKRLEREHLTTAST